MDEDGRLVLAGTPMGDVGDASPRLRAALASANVVAAEDTRRARALARALDVEITGRLVSFYDHNEAARIPGLLDDIRSGATVLLVTDAGMPSVSDPGYRLVAACVEADLSVTCLPGPSAVTTALAVSGLPVERFCFDGFAPRKQGARRSWLATLRAEARACVFFEAPHRLAACLTDAVEVLGPDRRAAVCRELTKTYEEVVRGTLADLAAWAVEGARGEITVVLAGAQPVADLDTLVAEVEQLVGDGIRLKDACAQVAVGGVGKKELYDAVLVTRRAE
ncbi:MAG TPA: 16S rRNA (cytidine(1402)-2'-O)-methyltransferase [Aldersonia sp.]